MLFAFRGIRMFQVVLAVVTLAAGVGGTFAAKGYADNRTLPLLFVAIILGGIFLWCFTTTLRAPTSYVAVAPERTRFRFAGFLDTVVDNRDIEGVRIVHRNILGGMGVRTNFAGDVALVSTWGDVAEVTLRRPLRVWLIPRLIPVRATRLQLSIRNPQKLVERFGEPKPQRPQPAAPHPKMKRRGSRPR
ncbi:MAG: hypothetical protein HYX53_04840 [Chloroflexi bacterium]|nr:hypothetical protein [Chloroflexota bacterium]